MCDADDEHVVYEAGCNNVPHTTQRVQLGFRLAVQHSRVVQYEVVVGQFDDRHAHTDLCSTTCEGSGEGSDGRVELSDDRLGRATGRLDCGRHGGCRESEERGECDECEFVGGEESWLSGVGADERSMDRERYDGLRYATSDGSS